MRIIGEIEHPTLKITVFKMENRLSVKLESGLYEQTYKFRSGEGIDTLEDVRRVLDGSFLEAAEQVVMHMNRIRNAALSRSLAQGAEEIFEEII